MTTIESNIFTIENLEQLNCQYRRYRIRGLSVGSDDFEKNFQLLIDKLSSFSQSPCAPIKIDDVAYITQPTGYRELPQTFNVIRSQVIIEKQDDIHELKFSELNKDTMGLAVRFLQFSLQKPLQQNRNLWRPKAGAPFYNKMPDDEFRKYSEDIDLYRGFAFRIIVLQDFRLGMAIDRSSKYVSRNPLPSHITPNDFQRIKGLKVIYEFGDAWYEIKIHELSDLSVSECIISNGSLYDLMHQQSPGQKSKLLLRMPKDCATLAYLTNLGEKRHVPSALCRRTLDTQQVRGGHAITISPPHIRRREIRYIVENYFRNITFNHHTVKLSQNPVQFQAASLSYPDLLFGNGKTLVQDRVRVDDLPRQKSLFLADKDAGFYVKKPFDKQYFIMPSSVYETYGKSFITDLIREANLIYRTEQGREYSPEIIVYSDAVRRSINAQGAEIVKTVKERSPTPGFGIIMIPRLNSKRGSKEDELANLVMTELRKLSIYVSVIHTNTAENSFERLTNRDGSTEWVLVDNRNQLGRYSGYLKNVVLNKILLLNNCYPFVLGTSLNADIVIGIDVKNRTAGFTLISKNADIVKFEQSASDQREQLGKTHIKKKIKTVIDTYLRISGRLAETILIHRDGRLFPQEMAGIKAAVNELITEGRLPANANCNFMEIRKSSRAPLRFFSIKRVEGGQREMVFNPFNGTSVKFDSDAYIITTGYPYSHKGTSVPLHVMWIEGVMGFEKALQDTFTLTNLTWTKIDDCSKVPLSIKMGDIHLREIAGGYDQDGLEFGEDEELVGGENNE